MKKINIPVEDLVILNAEYGRCPSCRKQLALTVGTRMDIRLVCPICGAESYGYKWRYKDEKTRKEGIKENAKNITRRAKSKAHKNR